MAKYFDFDECFNQNRAEGNPNEVDWNNLLDSYAKAVHKCAEFLSEKKFGFVSKYSGESYLERLGLFPIEVFNEAGRYVAGGKEKIWRSRENDKIERINAEYRAACKACNFLEVVDVIDKHGWADENAERKAQFDKDYKTILLACLNKGYQYPAMQLAEALSKNRVMIDINGELDKVLKRIEGNYAKKKAYNDRAQYLDADLLFPDLSGEEKKRKYMFTKMVETKDETFLSNLSCSAFGRSIAGQPCYNFFYELRKYYAEVLKSSRTNKSVRRNMVDDEEYEEEEL